jgi:hypothetical protein
VEGAPTGLFGFFVIDHLIQGAPEIIPYPIPVTAQSI